MSNDSSAQLNKPKFVAHNKNRLKDNSNNEHSVLNPIHIQDFCKPEQWLKI
jgi:hypothetical protein